MPGDKAKTGLGAATGAVAVNLLLPGAGLLLTGAAAAMGAALATDDEKKESSQGQGQSGPPVSGASGENMSREQMNAIADKLGYKSKGEQMDPTLEAKLGDMDGRPKNHDGVTEVSKRESGASITKEMKQAKDGAVVDPVMMAASKLEQKQEEIIK